MLPDGVTSSVLCFWAESLPSDSDDEDLLEEGMISRVFFLRTGHYQPVNPLGFHMVNWASHGDE